MIINNDKFTRMPASHIVAVVVPVLIVIVIIVLIISYCRKIQQQKHLEKNIREQSKLQEERTAVQRVDMPVELKKVSLLFSLTQAYFFVKVFPVTRLLLKNTKREILCQNLPI